jgi:DNA-binding NarL/FixJ family response regulator
VSPKPGNIVIKVFVCASTTVELAGLEALVRSAPALELAGTSLGRAGLSQQLEDTHADVLLEHAVPGDLEELPLRDLDSKSIARVLLVVEPEFPAALAAIQGLAPAVRGVLPAYASAREIQCAIEAAAAGLLVLHPDVTEGATSVALSRGSTGSLGQQLSPRESEILNLLAAGLGNKEIAWRLKLSEHTVKFHITSIFNKLNASSRAQAVAIGMRFGLIVL